MRRVFISLLLVSFLWGTSQCRAEGIAVIVNRTNPLNELPMAKLARIYKGQQQKWPRGGQIVVINRPVGSAIRKGFYKKVLNSKPNQKFYMPGTPIPFRSIVQRSSLATMRFINNMPEAIGYLYLNELEPDKSTQNIKIIQIIELEEGDLPAGKEKP